MNVPFRLPITDLSEICDRNESNLAKILDRNVLITGGSGFVGSWLTEAIVFARIEMGGRGRLSNLNRVASPFQEELRKRKLVDFHGVDVRDARALIDSFDYLVHGATPASHDLNMKNPDEMFDIIVGGGVALAETLLHPGIRVLNLSSGAVYGRQPQGKGRLMETDSLDIETFGSRNAYAEGKIRSERLLNEFGASLDACVVTARLFAFLAPLIPQDRHFAAGNFLRDAVAGRPISILGDPRTVRTYQYGTDMVTMLLRLLTEGEHGSAFNVGSEDEVTIGELATLFGSLANVPVVSSIGKSQDASQETSRYVPSIAAFRQKFGFGNSVSADEAAKRSFAWAKVERVGS